MNSLPLSEVYTSAWFHLGAIIAFALGCLWAGILYPFIRWDFIRAEHYCEVLNEVTWKSPYIFQLEELGTIATEATNAMKKSNPRTSFEIVFNTASEKFEVVKA